MDNIKPMEKPADQQQVETSSEIPDVANDVGPGGTSSDRFGGEDTGINPRNPSSMPRAEDDEATRQRSPEYHDGLGRHILDDQHGPRPERDAT